MGALLAIGIACLALGWLLGARWRAGQPVSVTPSDAGRALSALSRAEMDKRKRQTTQQLELYVKRSRR